MEMTRRVLALLLVCVFLATALPMAVLADETDEDAAYAADDGADGSSDGEYTEDGADEETPAGLSEEEEQEAAYNLLNNTGTGYFYYYRDHADDEIVRDAAITLPLAGAALSEGAAADNRDGVACARITGMNAYADFSFSVETEGLYAIGVRYQSIPSAGQDIDLSVTVDGQV